MSATWQAWIEPMLVALDHAGIGLVITRDGPSGLERLHDNGAAQRIFGRTAEEMRATPPLEMIPPDERARIGALRASIKAGAPAPTLLETEIARPDGTRVPIELGMESIRDGDSSITVVFLRDVSAQRGLQVRALEADRLATVGALCAGLAHEINNPLTSVLLHLGGLRRSLDKLVADPAGREHVGIALDTVLEGAGRVARAVRELMVFADPAAGERTAVDLRAVVTGAVRAAGPILETRARMDLALDDVPIVEGDPARLGQAVLNVILDAALALDGVDREHNRVAVRLRADDPWVVLEVEDNGPPPRAPVRGSAPRPFFPARGGASTGMGIAVTRTIVSASGGSVTVEPRAGGGVVTTIRLPRR